MASGSTHSATQRDVARLAGVSQPTVSLALNNATAKNIVSDEVRQRVEDAARLLNYRPNASARAMRSRRSFNIGYFNVIGEGFWDTDFPAFRAGIYESAANSKHHVVLIRMFHGGAKIQEEVPRIFREAHLDALVVNPTMTLPGHIQQALDSSGLPVVYLNDKRDFNAVYVDDYAGSKRMTEHLIAQGYQKIAFLWNGTRGAHYSFVDRLRAYEETVEYHRLPTILKSYMPHATYFSDGKYRFPTGRNGDEEFSNWLTGADAPDALFCYHDHTALLLQRLPITTGIHLPAGIGVSGYNNDEFLRAYFAKALTTMQIPRYEMAWDAVKMALELAQLARGSQLPAKIFTPTLVTGETTPRKMSQGR